jgi:hypothetical protein
MKKEQGRICGVVRCELERIISALPIRVVCAQQQGTGWFGTSVR